MKLHQLIPRDASIDVADLLAGAEFGDGVGDQRPYTIVNFIASADGRATFEGRSGALGDEADRQMFHGLREQVDAVLAGTRTLATERYGRILGKAERRKRRVQAGRSPEPLACVVTRHGDVPTDIPLFAEPEARIVVFGPADIELGDHSAQVEVVRLDPGELTLTTALRSLRADFGVASLLCEGGPTVFGALLHEQLVDELFLTLSPNLTGGGSSPTITTGAELPELARLSLIRALENEGALYLRYRLS